MQQLPPYDNVVQLITDAVRVTEQYCAAGDKKQYCLDLCRRALKDHGASTTDMLLFETIAPRLIDNLVSAANGKLFGKKWCCFKYP